MTDVDLPTDAPAADAPARSHTARNAALVVGAVLVLLVAFLATRPSSERTTRNQLVGRWVPELVGAGLDGKPVNVDTYRGKFVVVNFMAAWCGPCAIEHPELQRFAEAHPDDVQIVSVAYQDDPADIREFFDLRGGDWPVILDSSNAAVDFGITGVPESFIVAPNQLVVGHNTVVDFAYLEQMYHEVRRAQEIANQPVAPSSPGPS